MDFSAVKRGYFVGVGGVGINALAKFAADFGIDVCGSDAKINDLCKELIKTGAKISQNPDFSLLEKSDFLVFSSAIAKDNQERIFAKKAGIPTYERHEFLAEVSHLFGKVVAIAGTHGKTTTTAMLTQILFENGVKFASMIGGESIDFSNYVNNTGAERIADLKDCVFVCEACEYKRNLLALSPDVAAVLNAECDHPDCYDSMKSVKETFAAFLKKSKVKIVEQSNLDLIDTSIGKRNGFCVCVQNGNQKRIQTFVNPNGAKVCEGKKMSTLKLQDDGRYNFENATFALAAASACGLDFEKSASALQKYKGVKRRFERARDIGEAKVYFDFAHHPSEIQSVISRAAKLGKLLVVFQPHTYSRTKAYLDDFARVLGDKNNGVKTLAIMPTYAAREVPSNGVESDVLATAIFDKYRKKDVYLFKDKQSTLDFVKSCAKYHDIVLLIGAGDIYDLKDLF